MDGTSVGVGATGLWAVWLQYGCCIILRGEMRRGWCVVLVRPDAPWRDVTWRGVDEVDVSTWTQVPGLGVLVVAAARGTSPPPSSPAHMSL